MDGGQPDRQDRYPLPFDDHAPATAREHLRHVGGRWSQDLLEVALLATSELVTNAVRHGAGEVTLVVRSSTDVLRIEVHDGGDARDASLVAAAARRQGERGQGGVGVGSEGGRGLQIVGAVARRWGVSPAGQRSGKTVWFELAPPG